MGCRTLETVDLGKFGQQNAKTQELWTQGHAWALGHVYLWQGDLRLGDVGLCDVEVRDGVGIHGGTQGCRDPDVINKHPLNFCTKCVT